MRRDRSWRELEVCPLYELYLLRWEVKLQQDLGHSIVDMLKGLSSAAVQVSASPPLAVVSDNVATECVGLHGVCHSRHGRYVAGGTGERVHIVCD